MNINNREKTNSSADQIRIAVIIKELIEALNSYINMTN